MLDVASVVAGQLGDGAKTGRCFWLELGRQFDYLPSSRTGTLFHTDKCMATTRSVCQLPAVSSSEPIK